MSSFLAKKCRGISAKSIIKFILNIFKLKEYF